MLKRIITAFNFPDDESRLKLIIKILFIALITGMLLSLPLWFTERNFPLTPLFHFPEFSRTISLILLFALLLSASTSLFYSGQKILYAALFIFLIIEFLGDQNRWQPWCYQYLLMIWLLLFHRKEKDPAIILNSFRLIICGIYFWSGIQKFNHDFFDSTSTWLTQPLGNYFGKGFAGICAEAAKIIPFVEIFLAVGLMISRTRSFALVIAIAMHSYIILLMTPLGKNYNYVIIPWNLAMICFLLILFKNAKEVSLKNIASNIKTKYVIPVFILVWIMPAFSLFGKWDSYLSASLYSGNSDNAYIYVSKRLKESLPQEINKYVYTQLDTLFYIYVNEWSMKELKVPAYPEENVFLSARNKILKYANDSDEVKLLVQKKYTLLEDGHYIYLNK